jgi:hypothetical protein
MTNSTAELWADVVAMAREGVDATMAFRKIRSKGGRDLTKDDTEFTKIYERLIAQPLFAANMLLTLRRSEFQQALVGGVLATTPANDAEVDALMSMLKTYEEGSLQAMLDCIERTRTANPALADDLLTRARLLWPVVFAEKDARDAAAATRAADADRQLSLPLEPELGQAVPGVPA